MDILFLFTHSVITNLFFTHVDEKDNYQRQQRQQRQLGPLTVTKRVTNTNYPIQNDKDPTIPKTVHQNHLVEFNPKKETLSPMIKKSVPMDRRHDDFYERFTEQRIQKLNSCEPSSIEDYLPFPIEPLLTAPITLPQKPVSNTSSHSGVIFPHVLTPAVPVTPDNSQPYLLPSTSRTNPATGPLASIQHFIDNSRKSENKEPKDNRSQPNHLDPQPVLRIYRHRFLRYQVIITEIL